MHIVVIAASGSALEKRRGGVSSPFITFFFLLFFQKTKRKIKHRCHGTAACTSPGALPPRGAYAPAGQEGLLRSIFHRRAHGYCVLYEQARPAGGGVTVVSIDVKSQNTESGVMWANLRGRDEIARELCERGAYD